MYKGQLHFHSTNSDGADAPAAIVTAYRDIGYDFVCLSDHDFLSPDPGVAGVLYIPGAEETAIGGHIGRVYGLNPIVTTINQLILDTIWAVENGVSIFNHPAWAGAEWTDAEIAALYNYYALEIYNSQVSSNAESKWDTALTAGIRSFGVAADDCHDISNPAVFNTAAVHAFADACTSILILDALRTGNFYSTHTPPADTEIGVTSITQVGDVITITVDTISTIEFIGMGGAVLQTNVGVLTASYTVVGGEQYVRIRATAGGTSQAWSNPIWV